MAERSDFDRRSFLRSGLGTLAALVAAAVEPAEAAADQLRRLGGDDDELPPDVKRVFQQRFGDRVIRKGRVQLGVPENAPDGRAVPVFIETDLPMGPADYVKTLHLVVDHNPDIYLAGFELSPALGRASIDTRIKMRRSSPVRAIAETSRGELWGAVQMVYVTINGCG